MTHKSDRRADEKNSKHTEVTFSTLKYTIQAPIMTGTEQSAYLERLAVVA